MISPKTLLKLSLLLTLTATSGFTYADHGWNNYHWKNTTNGELNLELFENLDSTWEGHLWLASEDWSTSAVLDTGVSEGSISPRTCKVQAGNVQVCNQTYGNNGWLGIAGISVSGGHITAAYVKVNDSYFDSDPYNTAEWRQLVMCQEVGHTFGLGHQNENFNDPNLGSCMDYTSSPAGNTQPDSHDYDQLALIYDHDESGGGGGGSSGCNPRARWCNANAGLKAADVLASMETNGPSNWGRLISEHGPQEVYEIDLGHGQKIITHVTWTVERADDHQH